MAGDDDSSSGDVRSVLSGTASNVVQGRDIAGGIHYSFHDHGATRRVVPRELPRLASGFTNRVRELSQIDVAVAAGSEAGSCPIVIVEGTAGVGKTSVGLRWAHEVADRYPDGQLYLNLRGYHNLDPVQPEAALRALLEGLGTAPAAIPVEPDRREALYRSLMAGTQRIVFLDNASHARQVRPLLPGGEGSVVLVTTRGELGALRTWEGAHVVPVKILPEKEAVALLVRVAGATRGDDPDHLVELAWLCACLPLALRIAGERLARRPDISSGQLIEEVRAESARLLEALPGDGDPDTVRTVFSWSYRALSAEAAQMFRRLGAHPGPSYSLGSAAYMSALTVAQARGFLDELAAAHLVERVTADRYEFHDLLCAYAADLAVLEDGEDECRLGRLHVARWYLAGVSAASTAMGTDSLRIPPAGDRSDAAPAMTFESHAEAKAWYDDERGNLASAVSAAARSGGDGLAWRLAAALLGIYELNNAFDDWFATAKCGLDAARRAGDRYGEAAMLESMGNACRQSHQLEPAEQYLRESLAIREAIGDIVGQARLVNVLGLVYLRDGRAGAARACFERTAALSRQGSDSRLLGLSLVNLGEADAELREYEAAIGELEAAMEIFREIGQPIYEAQAHQNLSAVLLRTGRVRAALAAAARSVAISAELGNDVFLAEALMALAQARRASGDLEGALADYTEVVSIQRRLGDRSREGIAFDEIGAAYSEAGRWDLAVESHAEAATAHRELGDARREALAVHGLEAARRALSASGGGAG